MMLKAKQVKQKINNQKKAILKNMILYFISAIVFFLCSGSILVIRGWVYYLLVISGAVINNYFLLKYNPEVLSSRAEEGSNTKKWDKIILGFYTLIHIFIIPGISGLGFRFDWLQLSAQYIFLGVLLYLVSLIIITWAMVINKHFEGTVRIQTDRNQAVIEKGPYKYIRHPGNLGMILTSFVQPVIIGYVYTFIPGILAVIFVVIRTKLEDDMLQRDLDGYIDYAEKVKYRLIIKLW
ncbi:isoprenylcysteine carboxylmethyltransferase family protein [Halocella sp. SP3-1]|uniref:methyltransferase family protein n=1 Tax=Halocella sp. SP3-1 TaxID=2382161 RepID=UPI000F75873A|nr:isoprenylcysteine carboxylmethyltransferase family protein [Halocella sp. SP3-1]AZO96302.1 isoprenylcysteine carboxylmethyltransferase family protein [Halocella sp. SP3-1]